MGEDSRIPCVAARNNLCTTGTLLLLLLLVLPDRECNEPAAFMGVVEVGLVGSNTKGSGRVVDLRDLAAEDGDMKGESKSCRSSRFGWLF
jgi:hypothetical protein